jgi:hypothetical protein
LEHARSGREIFTAHFTFIQSFSHSFVLSRDVSIGREKNPIAAVNALDNEGFPTDYLYVNHNVETQELHINNIITSLQVCHNPFHNDWKHE